MEESEDPDCSQFATSSHPFPEPETPHPNKRPRTPFPPRSADSPHSSKASPSKPPRPHQSDHNLSLLLFSKPDDDPWQPAPVPRQSNFRPTQRKLLTNGGHSRSARISRNIQTSAISKEIPDAAQDFLLKSTEQESRLTGKAVSISHCARLVEAEVQKLLSEPRSDKEPPIRPLDDFEVPSPPLSLSTESEQDSAAHPENKLHLQLQEQNFRPIISKARELPLPSQDSKNFSFPNESYQQNAEKNTENVYQSVDLQSSANNPQENENPTEVVPYYMRTFDYVLVQVLARHSHVLRSNDSQVASLLREKLSRNAYCLFVRIYRRKQPSWYRVLKLNESYGDYIDIQSAVVELGKSGLLISSAHAAQSEKAVRLLLARELLDNLRAGEVKSLVKAVSNHSEHLKKLPLRDQIPALSKILSEGSVGDFKRSKYRQSTLTGCSQSDLLVQAIFKQVDHAVKIPESVLVSLQRIHFLFFLENGHDSPNVLLADTGKAKFPEYKCEPKNGVFSSCYAYESYEAALKLEQQLEQALGVKDYERAADIGSIAELEVREFLACIGDSGSQDAAQSLVVCRTQADGNRSSTCDARADSVSSSARKAVNRTEAAEQLRHPFFRRYTAHWVHVRCLWHSVQALERLGEFENATQRLKVLLSTELIPARRGKCLNRLTVNLFKHQDRLREALDIILSALQSTAPRLHFGDYTALVKRGMNIHRKLVLSFCENEACGTAATKAERKRMISAAVIAKRPRVLSEAAERYSANVKVRKIYGKSLQITRRERERKSAKNRTNSWRRFLSEDSKDSFATSSTDDAVVRGKSKYKSFGSRPKEISVESYCLEWYLGKDGWRGVHDEGASIRFLFTLLFWESALFAPVDDVFQTPYQDRPLDLSTETFYPTRKSSIENRLKVISEMNQRTLRDEVRERYERYELVRAVGCGWKSFSAEDLSHIGAGLGGRVLAHCCRLLCQDYSYWGGGLPDLTLWLNTGIPESEMYHTKLVEVKSARDNLSERQRAWLVELQAQGAECEVCKVVERVTSSNSQELEDATLDSVAIGVIDAANSDEEL